MTIKITDKRTGEELSLREFDVSCTPDNHLVFGWEYSGDYTEEDCDYSEIYEVAFPEVEELKKEIERLKATIAEKNETIKFMRL